jgi:serine/threonine protein kinase
MSPELFVPTVVGPTPASDMWAYGCVALEVGNVYAINNTIPLNTAGVMKQILCRVQPYHEIVNDYDAVELIKQGQPPSNRPRGARAALVNDSLWTTLASCWQEQGWRPTSRMFLERLVHMLQNGEVSTSPILMDLFPITIDGPLVPWPDDIRDLKGLITIEKDNGKITSSLRTTVWM